MALLTHGTGPLLTPTGLKHVAARGRAAQGERQQTGRGENENDGDHEYEVHHRPAPIDRAREASRRTTRSTMPTARRRNGNSRPKQATASTTNSRITDSTTHHPPLTEGCLSIEDTASSPLRASTSRINASISSDTMPAPAS